MTEVVLETEDEEYYEIFSSSLFDGKLKRPLNNVVIRIEIFQLRSIITEKELQTRERWQTL